MENFAVNIGQGVDNVAENFDLRFNVVIKELN